MHDHQAACLRAVRDLPDDDGPRLVYADWLEEFGTTAADRARARFIRLQVEWERIGERRRPPLADRARQLDGEAADLLARFREEWLRDVPRAAWERTPQLLFQRGFLSFVQVNADEVPAAAPGPWAREPVASVALSGTAPVIGRVFARPWLEGVRRLSLQLGVPEGFARLRMQEGPLAADRALDEQTEEVNQIAESIATAPFSLHLRSLYLTHPRLHDGALRALAASPTLRNLRSLSLAGEFSPGGWSDLANSALADRLESLSLMAWGPVEGEPDRRRIGPEGAAVLAAAPRLGKLRTLSLVSDRFGADGLRSILTSEYLVGLRCLCMTHDSLDARDRELFGPSVLPGLEDLRLLHCCVTPDTVRALATSGLLIRLKHLNLFHNGFSGEAVRALLDGPAGAYRVEVLGLGYNPIGDGAVTALAGSDRFPGLTQLNLAQTGLTDAGAAALLNAPWADRLDRLDLRSNNFSAAMEGRLRARFGSVVRLRTSD